MCKLIEDMANERAERAAERADEKAKTKFAVKLLSQGKMSIEEIADLTELSIEDVKTLAAQLNPALA